MAAMVGSSGSGVYCAAISQAPVTDWRYYGEAWAFVPCMPTTRGVCSSVGYETKLTKHMY